MTGPQNYRYLEEMIPGDGDIHHHNASHDAREWLTLQMAPSSANLSRYAVMKKSPIIEQDEAAWRAGFLAGNLGRSTPCPYPPTSLQALSWSSGKIGGAAKPPGTLPLLRPIKAQP